MRALALLPLLLTACVHPGGPTEVGPVDKPVASNALAANDLLEVRVYGEPDLSGVYRVDPDGYVYFPLCGKVEVGGHRAKPSRSVRAGDALRIPRGIEVFELTVVALSDVRGAAPVAQALYSEAETSKAARAEARQLAAAARAGYAPPESKPDKRARRLIRALGDIDAL